MSLNYVNGATGNAPNLKPFRDVDGHDIVNLYAHKTAGDVNKGSLVKLSAYTSVGSGNTNVWQSVGRPYNYRSNGADGTIPSYVYVDEWLPSWFVENTTSGDLNPLGLTLVDIRDEKSSWPGEKVKYDRMYQISNDVIPTGQAVPVATRGLFKTNGWVGVDPVPGSGAAVSNTEAGKYDVVGVDRGVPGGSGYIGKWLSGPDTEGYAILKLEL